jgi:hypothetical protein
MRLFWRQSAVRDICTTTRVLTAAQTDIPFAELVSKEASGRISVRFSYRRLLTGQLWGRR